MDNRIWLLAIAATAAAANCCVNAADEYTNVSCGVLQQNTNFAGNDIGDGHVVANASDCCSLCLQSFEKEGLCRFFTFNPAVACQAGVPKGR